MYLYEEYLSRKNLNSNGLKHTDKAYIFFGPHSLLSIKWTQKFTNPGVYEISECCLKNKNVKVLSTNRVFWEEYHSFIGLWHSRNKNNLIFDRSKIFEFTWHFFLRKYEKSLTEYLAEVFETIDPDNSERVLKIADFLEKLTQEKPDISNFWESRLSSIFSHYAYWMKELA